MPNRLPPYKDTDHRIVPKDDHETVNQRPYRYSSYQKDEIESLVAEILHAGIIRPSHGPYASPILLVKKKDRCWRFYINYRALNELMVSNKFPIPVIEDRRMSCLGQRSSPS